MFPKSACLLATALPVILALPQAPAAPRPKTGENGNMGGLFGMGASPSIPKGLESIASSLGKGISSIMPNIDPTTLMYTGPEYPKGKVSVADYYSPGTGPYPAGLLTDPGLPNHVIYAPKNPPPAGVKMPVLLWGNGGCTSSGTPYGMFLTEVASYGYLAIANGPPGGAPPSLDQPRGQMLPGPDGKEIYPKQSAKGNGQSKVQDMLDAQDWVVKGGAKRFGDIDIDSFITGGSSCGGLEAYSASYNNPRVKLVGVYNSGLLDASKTPLLKELTAKIAYFAGGPKAIEYTNTERDYKNLPEGLPAVFASLDTGHMGTFFAKNGGKYAKASVDLFEWVFRNDQAAKARWTDPKSAGSLVSQNWNVTMKNLS